MIELIRPGISVDMSDDGTYGTVIIEPLEKGYGTTIGNSLRRVMLSSLSGTAVVSIKINGGEPIHEFSTVRGVKEDVCEIVLNVKQIKAKLNTDGLKTAYIDVNGPCKITTANIVCDTELEIIDKNVHLATLSDGEHFTMELVFSNGRGYVAAHTNKAKYNDGNLGSIYVDSIYTPAIAVRYSVENTRVESVTDYERLVLDVKTNGVVNVKEAVKTASDILNSHFMVFDELDADKIPVKLMCTEEDEISKKLSIHIEELELSVRSYNCLKRSGINTLEDLTTKTESQMLMIRNLGMKSFKEIKELLEEKGLGFAEEV